MSSAPPGSRTPWLYSRQASVVMLVVVLLAIVGLSLSPRPERVLGRLSAFDKLGHLVAYIALGFFACRAMGRPRLFHIVLTVASGAVLGGLIEVVQPLVGRNREFVDFVVDLGGAAVGAVIAFLTLRRQSSGRG